MPQPSNTASSLENIAANFKSGDKLSTITMLKGFASGSQQPELAAAISIERTAAQMREFFPEHKTPPAEGIKKEILEDLKKLVSANSAVNPGAPEALASSKNVYLEAQKDLEKLKSDFQKLHETFNQFDKAKETLFKEIVQRSKDNKNDSAIPILLKQLSDKEKSADLTKNKDSYFAQNEKVSEKFNAIHSATKNFVSRLDSNSLTPDVVQQQITHLRRP